jgi:hypothetical protein
MISLNSGFFNPYFEAVDFLLEEPNIGRIVTLVYTIKKNINSMDYEDLLDTTEEVTETINLRLYHSPRDWMKSGMVQFVDGRVQVLGYMADVDKLRKATEIRLDNVTYKLASEPVRHGFGSRYFLAFLDLI